MAETMEITKLRKIISNIRKKAAEFDPAKIDILDTELEQEATRLGYKLAILDVIEIVEDAIIQEMDENDFIAKFLKEHT